MWVQDEHMDIVADIIELDAPSWTGSSSNGGGRRSRRKGRAATARGRNKRKSR